MAEERNQALPEAFKAKMRGLLGEEYEVFLQSYEKERVQGLRINTLKAELGPGLADMAGRFGLSKIPWVNGGFYYDGSTRPGKHPFHEAGVYYIQEPSAMAVVELLDPQPGDLVLDMCAAPGGKSTQIAARLGGRGFLLSNEIHPARARILAQNIERMGIGNAVVTSEDTGHLADRFPDFFDKIVVDAPCSGEGMFRKDEDARAEWSPDNVVLCARRQQEILENAAGMLKCGGRLVYSTCTFSPEENEGSIETFLKNHPDFQVEQVCAYDGFAPGHPEWVDGGRAELKDTYRIWPHKMEGEGHYLAVLKKDGDNQSAGNGWKRNMPSYVKEKAVLKELQGFLDATLVVSNMQEVQQAWKDHLLLFGDQLYALPEAMTDLKGLKIVRPGLHLGTMKKNRFEPSHALALYLNRHQVCQWYNMDPDDSEIAHYLNGETLPVPTNQHLESEEPVKTQVAAEEPAKTQVESGQSEKAKQRSALSWNLSNKGWVLMTVDGYSIGWAKLAGRTLKNHYPKGLRRQL